LIGLEAKLTDLENVKNLLDAVVNQSQVLMSLATAGLAGTVFAVSRTFNLTASSDTSFKQFRLAGVLVAPLVLFVAALFFGYLIVSSVQGFYTEVALKPDEMAQFGGNLAKFYEAHYSVAQSLFQIFQIGFSILGYALLLLWYSANIFAVSGDKK
jgi:hypothetical protein